MRRDNGLVTDVALGALAGLIGTWAMGLATSYLYEREDEQARQREDQARNGRTAYAIAVEKAAGAVGVQLRSERRDKLGGALHWVLGAGAGAAYGAIRHLVPGPVGARGALFGTAFWALVDEGANTALRLTPPPRAFPWQAHARGLAGHLVFGAVTDGALSAADAMLA